MKIIRNEQEGTLTLAPVSLMEEQIVNSIASVIKPDDKISYGGRTRDEENEKFCAVHLHIGGRRERREQTTGHITISGVENIGGIELILQGTTEDDKYEVAGIRNMCFFGSGGLIFLRETQVDGQKALVVTGKRCKHCGKGMIDMSSCEWGTCGTCAGKCDHNYVEGMVHGGDVDIGIGHYCDKCGRGKPKEKGEREKTVIEHHLEVQEKLAIKVAYQNGPPHSPEEAVKLNRLVRKHAESRRRATRVS